MSSSQSALAERKECRPSCLQHGHTVYCQTCRTVPNSPSWALSPPPLIPNATNLLFSPLSLLHHLLKAWEDSQVVSSSCVSSCLVSWCACSCQYLCLLWIACFSPWLDTNVAHQLLLTLCGQTLGILLKLSREPNNLLQIYHMCYQFCKKTNRK